MILSDKEIISRVHTANLISPFIKSKISQITKEDQVIDVPSFGLSHCGYDICLQPRFRIARDTIVEKPRSILDTDSESWYEVVEKDSIVMPPHSFMLGVSEETFKMPYDLAGLLLCKSTLARMGLFFPPTISEPGWHGELVVEIFNSNPFPLEVHAGVGIGQMIFTRLSGEVKVPYSGKYQGQTGLTVGRMR